jgi:cobalt-precorrin 5A hydrolase
MKGAVFSFTRKGARLSIRLKKIFEEHGLYAECFTAAGFLEEDPELKLLEPDLRTVAGSCWRAGDFLIFVSACGIAVRTIASLITDKQSDPAVLCLDERGTFVIPLLAGHLGGANRLAGFIAREIGAQPVITTATDVNNLPAIDEWAKANHLEICDLHAAKKISALLLDGGKVGFFSDLSSEPKRMGTETECWSLNEECQAGICLSYREDQKPYPVTLNLIPKNIYLGIGCRKGVSAETIDELVREVLSENKISRRALAAAASVDLKKEEKGLLDFAAQYKMPLQFFTAAELNALDDLPDAALFLRAEALQASVLAVFPVRSSCGRLPEG